MAQWVRALTTKPKDLSLVAGTHMAGENGFQQADQTS